MPQDKFTVHVPERAPLAPEIYRAPETALTPETARSAIAIDRSAQVEPGHYQPASAGLVQTPPPGDRYRRVESILEEDLGELYGRLLPGDQEKFKVKGEETTGAIVQIISQPKIKIQKIIDLIIGWLKIIPGINRFFLEQMAKIKTDKIMAAARKERGEIM